MKICYLSLVGAPTVTAATDRKTGGLNTTLYNLASTLASGGDEVYVVCASGSTGSATTLQNGFNLIQLSQPDSPEFLREAEEVLREIAPDVVHTAGSEAGSIVVAMRESGFHFPWVHTAHATLSVRRVVLEGLDPQEAVSDDVGRREAESARSCDHFLAVSASDKEEVMGVFGLPENKVTVVWRGVDHKIFFPSSSLEPRDLIVLGAGRMSRNKDFPFLIRAFALIVPKIPQAHLVIIGGNSAERSGLGLARLVEELGLSSLVTFLDGMPQDQLGAQLRRARVFAGVSLHETFGLMPVEARACGTPAVVRGNSGYLAATKDGNGALVAKNDSVEDFAEKLLLVLSMRGEEWESFSRQAIASVEKFRWSRTAAICRRTYRKVQRRNE